MPSTFPRPHNKKIPDDLKKATTSVEKLEKKAESDFDNSTSFKKSSVENNLYEQTPVSVKKSSTTDLEFSPASQTAGIISRRNSILVLFKGLFLQILSVQKLINYGFA